MSTAPKDAKAATTAAAPAKAPAKAGAKGAAKTAAKKKVAGPNAKRKMFVYMPDGPKKKNKHSLTYVPPTAEEIKQKQDARAAKVAKAEASKAQLKQERANHLKKVALRQSYAKLIKEAKAKGQPKPDVGRPNRPKGSRGGKAKAYKKKRAQKAKGVTPAKKDEQKPKRIRNRGLKKNQKDKKDLDIWAQRREAKKEALQGQKFRYVMKLTPINKAWHERFGILYSEYIGKAREKALRARFIHVGVHRHGHPLNGKVGQLAYYTGKHSAFVLFKHRQVAKLPVGILFRRRKFFELSLGAANKKRNTARLNDYTRKKMAFKRRVAQAKKDGRPEPATPAYLKDPFKPIPLVLPPLSKFSQASVAKKAERLEKQKAAGIDKLPVRFFKNVGRPHKNLKAFFGIRAAKARIAAREEKKKVAAAKPKKPVSDAIAKKREQARQANRRRRGQKGKPRHTKKAAAAQTPKDATTKKEEKKRTVGKAFNKYIKRAQALKGGAKTTAAAKPAATKPAAAKPAAAKPAAAKPAGSPKAAAKSAGSPKAKPATKA